ncbi:MAG: sodium:solute symporter [Flavobacteriaceae bacterium]
MSTLDWNILIVTLGFIVIYGVWKNRKQASIQDYIQGGKQARWWTVGLSVMATQASAITFLSTPGQAFQDGMGFVQFYFGLPLAMIVICLFFLPIYHRLKVYTAYEFLENRFDRNTRTLTALLFLVQRGLAAGITIYAPAIILSVILNWPLNQLILGIGALVIVYTLVGGTKAVNVTQKQQMGVIFLGLIAAFWAIIERFPSGVQLSDALQLAGAAGRLEVLDFSLDPKNRYTFWSGITGGMFLALSYFGTDQSQVQRYLSGKSLRESQLGLVMNGFLKVPMQFFILLIGVLVFVSYQYEGTPIHFHPQAEKELLASPAATQFQGLQQSYQALQEEKKQLIQGSTLPRSKYKSALEREQHMRLEARKLVEQHTHLEANDTDYVFITFILKYLPTGIIGLLLAMIFSAAMSSTASELNALSATSLVDLYRSYRKDQSPKHYVQAAKFFTLIWGVLAISFALYGTLFENLIQLVNIIGSIFYGTILGIFLVAFFLKRVQGKAIFWAAIVSEALIIGIFLSDTLSFLWLNVAGALITIFLALLLQFFLSKKA